MRDFVGELSSVGNLDFFPLSVKLIPDILHCSLFYNINKSSVEDFTERGKSSCFPWEIVLFIFTMVNWYTTIVIDVYLSSTIYRP